MRILTYVLMVHSLHFLRINSGTEFFECLNCLSPSLQRGLEVIAMALRISCSF